MRIAISVFLLASATAQAHAPLENFHLKPILADLKDLRALNIPVLAKDEVTEVAYTQVTPEMLQQIQQRAHRVGKCGGFEDLSLEDPSFLDTLDDLRSFHHKNLSFSQIPFRQFVVVQNEQVKAALEEVREDNLRAYVQWLSSFPTRSSREDKPNIHVDEMKQRLEAMMSEATIPYEIFLVEHTQTRQKTLGVRLMGSEQPQEIVVLGGHLDSVNNSWGGNHAPGADDNASGSANLIEALRILSTKAQPKRTVEFYWYAAEEAGLLGSAEIAKRYKSENKDVIAVLQLDMTLYPGSGEMVIGSMTDFTSAWLRDYLKSINTVYLNARLIEDKCGYGCSDHASWHRQGFPTLMPFEAAMRGMNGNIHTGKDVISPQLNFRHSAMYSKIALVFAMDLANSQNRQPF